MDQLDLRTWTCMQMTTYVHMRRDSETLSMADFQLEHKTRRSEMMEPRHKPK